MDANQADLAQLQQQRPAVSSSGLLTLTGWQRRLVTLIQVKRSELDGLLRAVLQTEDIISAFPVLRPRNYEQLPTPANFLVLLGGEGQLPHKQKLELQLVKHVRLEGKSPAPAVFTNNPWLLMTTGLQRGLG